MTIRVFKWAAAFALAVALLLAASGYRILYSRYQFTEYQPYQEGVVRIPVRNVVTCHYFAGLSFEYAVVPARHTAWCSLFCKPAVAASGVFRGMMRPGYSVAQQPICKARS